MLVLRCTKKLLTRLHAGPAAPGIESTTVLGDWYATIHLMRPAHLILLVNERSRLSVVLPARELSTLLRRIPDAAAQVLLDIGVGARAVAQERSAMSPIVLAQTQSRSVLGTMNEFIFHIDCRREDVGELDPRQLSLELGRDLVGPLEYERPADVARRLLSGDPLNSQLEPEH